MASIRTRLFGNVEEDADRETVRKGRVKKVTYILIVALLALLLAAYSVTINSTTITNMEIYQTIVNQIFPGTFPVDEHVQMIVMKVYVPRVLMAFLVGGIFAIGGCIVQTILKNPLATPYTLGVSASAAFGAGMSIILGLNVIAGFIGTVTNAFLFSLIPAAIILLATAKRNMTATTMILIGISLSYLFSAANTLMQYFGDAEAVKQAMFWTVGDLNNVMLSQIPYVAVTLLLTIVGAAWLLKDIDIMRMGDDTATTLGVNVKRIRTMSIVLACFSTAVAVSFVGAIGFVCLLSPQISRIFVGNSLRYLLPASMFTGSALLVAADIVAKSVLAPIMLPVGAITAVIGAPILIYLLIQNKNTIVS